MIGSWKGRVEREGDRELEGKGRERDDGGGMEGWKEEDDGRGIEGWKGR